MFANFFNIISIQPNLNADIQDEIVLSISLAKKKLLEKNLEESVRYLLLIEDGKTFFDLWLKQAEYYIETNKILKKIINS